MSVAVRRPRLFAALLAAATAFAFTPAARAESIPVSGVQTAVAPDAGLVDALTSLGTSVGLTGAGSADDSGRFVFPVTGGQLTPELKGFVRHSGGIEFKTRAGVRFGIRNFVIDTRRSPVLLAEPTVGSYGLRFRVPVATIEDLSVGSSGDATVVGGTLKLTDIGALYINVFLGRTAVKKGTTFGAAEATVTLAAPAS